MRLRPLLAGTAIAGVGLLSISACATPSTSSASGSSSSDAPAAPNKTLVMSLPGAPDTLDPTKANTFAARELFASMCEGLYTADANLTVVPQLASDLPQVSPDGKSMDISLRTGIKFADGTDFNADAVVKTLNRDLTLQGSSRTKELSAVQSVTATSPTQVHIDLKYPSAPLVAQLADRAGLIMSPAALDKEGDSFGANPVCVGPFKFQSQVPGSEIDLVKDPAYYDADQVKLAGLNYKFINTSSVAAANLQSGDLSAAEHLDPSDALNLKAADLPVLSANTIAYQSIEINVRKDATTALSQSADLRKAFEMSIDRNALNKAVWQGTQAVDCNPLSPQSPYYPKVDCTPFDAAGAKQIVAASGVKTPIPVELMVPSGTAGQRESQVIQSMANAVGFQVSVKQLDLVSALQLARSGQFDVFLEGWSGRVDPDGDTNDLLTTGGSNNFSGLSDPQVDSLVQQAASTSDQAKRKDLYSQIVTRIADVRSNIYLYHDTWFVGTAKNVHGIVYNADGIPRMKTAYMS
jgi:peptide/nickel transport system substrate-binding protein